MAAAEPEVTEMLAKFCKFDSGCYDASMQPRTVCSTHLGPGAPPTPIKDMVGMMDALKAGPFPDWNSKFHGATKNADGTYSVLTQQCVGTMEGDFPAMGAHQNACCTQCTPCAAALAPALAAGGPRSLSLRLATTNAAQVPFRSSLSTACRLF